MPKKKNEIDQKEQSRRFLEKATELGADGSQSLTDASDLFEKITDKLTSTASVGRIKPRA